MARTDQWEAGFRSAARAGRIGWTVNNKGGRIQLKVRLPNRPQQTKLLPLPWEPKSQAAALQLIGRIYQLVEGNKETLQKAADICLGVSDTMAPTRSWPAIADSLKDVLQTGRNQIHDKTWQTNYWPYIKKALELLSGSQPPRDGYELLKQCLQNWPDKPPSRSTCCIAIRNLTDHGIARFGLEACWRIDQATIKELKGKAGTKRIKATLDDREILYLIRGIESRNPRWANVIRLLALFGLRPIELQYINKKTRDNGSLGLWCSYQKNCGGTLTKPRWLEPCWLRDESGELQRWNLIGAIHAGLLELPVGNTHQTRLLNGHYVEQFLRTQPEWKELRALATDKGEWLRPYTFRDSYSLRCHRYKLEVGSIARAMGHSIAVHSSSYRWSSDDDTAAAFAQAMQA
jgi:integrase